MHVADDTSLSWPTVSIPVETAFTAHRRAALKNTDRQLAEQNRCALPPSRRRSLSEALRSEGDAQTVRLLASLRREGMPEELLVNAFQGCLEAYTPEVDRLRSPFIHSLVWFQPWIENVVGPWRREQGHQRVREEQLRRREVEKQQEAAESSPPPVTSFEEFTERYGGRTFLPPSEVLCEELDGFAADVAAHHRERGSSKREILVDVMSRTYDAQRPANER